MRSVQSFVVGLVASVGFVLVTVVPAQAAAIEFVATDLLDLTLGEDLWSYEYFISGFVFDADQGFSVYFDETLYESLESPVVSPADWDVLTFQPDLLLPDAGRYDALALASAASLTGPFSLTFVWLGGPAGPGIQLFTIDEFALDSSITQLQSGATRPLGAPVPEPGSLLLLAAAVGAFARRRFLTSGRG